MAENLNLREKVEELEAENLYRTRKLQALSVMLHFNSTCRNRWMS